MSVPLQDLQVRLARVHSASNDKNVCRMLERAIALLPESGIVLSAEEVLEIQGSLGLLTSIIASRETFSGQAREVRDSALAILRAGQ